MKKCMSCRYEHQSYIDKCPKCGWQPDRILGLESFAPQLAVSRESYRPEYYETLEKVEEEHFWFRARRNLIVWVVKKHFPALKCLLDLGCGSGQILAAINREFPNADLLGGELLSEGLAIAAKKVPNAQFIQIDARDIPFREEFDLIGAFDVVEHIDDDEQVFRCVFEALKPEGGFVVTVPQHDWLWSETDRAAGHVRRYSRELLCSRLMSAGFEVKFSSSFVTFLLPILFISRLTSKNRNQENTNSAECDGGCELNLSPSVNTICFFLMRLESLLIRFGCRFPIGGSLLMVAIRPPAKTKDCD